MRRRLSELADSIGSALARVFSARRPAGDADAQFYLESAARIGVRVAGVAAALVISIIALFVLYVIWQESPAQLHEHHGPTDVHIYLDTVDIAIAVTVLGVFSIALTCIATWIIAGRAVRPLGDALRMQRRFVADASHELRTPLAVLSARVQRLQSLVAEDDERRPLVDDLREDTRVMIDIVGDLLQSAAGEPQAPAEASLRTQVEAAVHDMSVIAAEHGIALHAGALPDVAVRVPAVQLRRAIVSLLDNAIDHTPEGGAVELSGELVEGRVRLRFTDTGTGITGIDPERVFDRFAHGAQATRRGRRRTRTGYGIGLSLVREIAVRNRGGVAVESTGPGGTTFVIEFPALAARR